MDKTRVVIALASGAEDARPFERKLAPLQGDCDVTYAIDADLDRALGDAEVLVAQRPTDALLARAHRLRWFAAWAAGMDSAATSTLSARGIALTNASGVHGPNIAEHVLMMMLMFTRRAPFFLHAQEERRWEHEVRSRSDGEGELTGKTLAIVGFGAIGEAIASRAKPFGMHVIGVKRDPSTRRGTSATVDEVVGMSALDDVLTRADHVCIAAPSTPETRHLLDARRIALLRPTAYVYNIARGALIDEAALTRALEEKRIAGAGLDVFETEPLPKESPLWALPNVILTPHVSGYTPHYFERMADLFVDNLARYRRGEPLRNRYDAKRGY